MHRIVISSWIHRGMLLAAALLFLAAGAAAQSPFDGARGAVCANGTLVGAYGVIGQGAIVAGGVLPAPLAGPFAQVGLINFDVQGNFTFDVVNSFNGQVQPLATVTGKITVNADCSVSLLDSLNISLRGTVLKGGDELLLTPVVPGIAVPARAFRIKPRQDELCSLLRGVCFDVDAVMQGLQLVGENGRKLAFLVVGRNEPVIAGGEVGEDRRIAPARPEQFVLGPDILALHESDVRPDRLIIPFEIAEIARIRKDVFQIHAGSPARMRHHDVGNDAFLFQLKTGARRRLAVDRRFLKCGGVRMHALGDRAVRLVVERLDDRRRRALSLRAEINVPALAREIFPDRAELRGEIVVQEENPHPSVYSSRRARENASVNGFNR